MSVRERENLGSGKKAHGVFKRVEKVSNRHKASRKECISIERLGKKHIKCLCEGIWEAMNRHPMEEGLCPVKEFIEYGWQLATKETLRWCCVFLPLQK